MEITLAPIVILSSKIIENMFVTVGVTTDVNCKVTKFLLIIYPFEGIRRKSLSEGILAKYPQSTRYLKEIGCESKSDAAVMTATTDGFSDWRHKRSEGL
jgi:hypothetical protein